MILSLSNISKSFGKDQTYVEALKPTDFHVKHGEMVAVIGPSGSGKSTLLTISGLLQTPTTGEVIINNQNVTQYSDKKRAGVRLKEIGFIL